MLRLLQGSSVWKLQRDVNLANQIHSMMQQLNVGAGVTLLKEEMICDVRA